MKYKFMSELSTDALKEIFAIEGLNCPLAEHVLRMLAGELVTRGEPMTKAVYRAIEGPKFCYHGRPMANYCNECGDGDS